MKSIRMKLYQGTANFKKIDSYQVKKSYPLPPYSTIISIMHSIGGI